MTTATTGQDLRKWGGVIDRNRPWQMEVDGNVVGSIAPQKTVEFSVEPGDHIPSWPMYVAALIKPDLWITLKSEPSR